MNGPDVVIGSGLSGQINYSGVMPQPYIREWGIFDENNRTAIMKFTERIIQRALYDHRRGMEVYPNMVPNVYQYNWESDLLQVSKAHYVTEYEIKISRSDFLADKKKTRRWWMENYTEAGPKFFYYAAPVGLIKKEDIPKGLGLIEVAEDDRLYCPVWKLEPGLVCRVIVKPIARKPRPLTDSQMILLLKKAAQRMWARGNV